MGSSSSQSTYARLSQADESTLYLVCRFELPFNIWCGHCNSHLGAGVRYNAQKRKVGNYYSTPIYAFRCKCHLCSGWFEIRTDPKVSFQSCSGREPPNAQIPSCSLQNAKYHVEKGAREQVQDWNPEENGGFAVHGESLIPHFQRPSLSACSHHVSICDQDTEAPTASEPPPDAFSALEKDTHQKTALNTTSDRLEALAKLSYRTTSDPYTMSQHLRARHRQEKRRQEGKERKDQEIRDRFGLGERVKLLDSLDESESSKEWSRARQGRSTGTNDFSATTLRNNTLKRYHPFGTGQASGSERIGVKSLQSRSKRTPNQMLDPTTAAGTTDMPLHPKKKCLVDYTSDQSD